MYIIMYYMYFHIKEYSGFTSEEGNHVAHGLPGVLFLPTHVSKVYKSERVEGWISRRRGTGEAISPPPPFAWT
jgi:hypothetical protein